MTRIRRVHAIVNPTSGGVGPGAADHVAAVLADFGLDHRVSELSPGGMYRAIERAVDGGPDLMIVLGGDGTTRLVAELCGPNGPLVAPLSGGTMNKLDRALYGARPWRDALTGLLSSGEERWVPGGEVAGRAFYCSAVLGPPALGARAREAIRARQFGRAWRQAVSAFHGAVAARLRFEFDSREIGRGVALGLLCPTILKALDGDEGLEAAVLDVRDLRGGARLALNHLFGDWRDDPGVTVRLSDNGVVLGRDPVPGMLDGELFHFGRRVEYRFLPRAFRVLAPGPESDAGAAA